MLTDKGRELVEALGHLTLAAERWIAAEANGEASAEPIQTND